MNSLETIPPQLDCSQQPDAVSTLTLHLPSENPAMSDDSLATPGLGSDPVPQSTLAPGASVNPFRTILSVGTPPPSRPPTRPHASPSMGPIAYPDSRKQPPNVVAYSDRIDILPPYFPSDAQERVLNGLHGENLYTRAFLDRTYQDFASLFRIPKTATEILGWFESILGNINHIYEIQCVGNRTRLDDFRSDKLELQRDKIYLQDQLRAQKTEHETHRAAWESASKIREDEWNRREADWKASENTWKTREDTWKTRENDLKRNLHENDHRWQARHNEQERHIEILSKRSIQLEDAVEHWKSAFFSGQRTFNNLLGSETPAEVWKNLKVEQLGALPGGDQGNYTTNLTSVNKQALRLENQIFTDERSMYKPLIAVMSACVAPENASILDTSSAKYLSGLSPDISICLPGMENPDSCFVYGVIEIKMRNEGKLDSDSNCGQLANYLLRLHKAQPERTHFWGFLSNFKENILLTMSFTNTKTLEQQVQKYRSVSLSQAIPFMRQQVAPGQPATATPQLLPFGSELGVMHRRLATTRKWMVSDFRGPSVQNVSRGKVTRMIVKASLPRGPGISIEPHHLNELLQLRRLSTLDPPVTLAKLVYEPDWQKNHSFSSMPAGIEFGITPGGIPLAIHNFTASEQLASALINILEAIEWLHVNARTVHRDLRPDNIIYDQIKQTAVIVDFDCSWTLPDGKDWGSTETSYGGGIICIPECVLTTYIEDMPDISKTGYLNNVTIGRQRLTSVQYCPVPEHDYCAFVLVVMALLFPREFYGLKVYTVLDWGDKSGPLALQDFFLGISKSQVWGPWWKLAKNGDVGGLKKISELVFWPSLKRPSKKAHGQVGPGT